MRASALVINKFPGRLRDWEMVTLASSTSFEHMFASTQALLSNALPCQPQSIADLIESTVSLTDASAAKAIPRIFSGRHECMSVLSDSSTL